MPLSLVRQHYETVWEAVVTPQYWSSGPLEDLPNGFCVLEFAALKTRDLWTYATVGMSERADCRVELHVLSQDQDESLVELLTAVAHYHVTGPGLGLGHTVNFGRPWRTQSNCGHGLLSLPYLDGPKLEYLDAGDLSIRFLVGSTRARRIGSRSRRRRKSDDDFPGDTSDFG